jgi:heme exporter protein A
MTGPTSLVAKEIRKVFNRRVIFERISFALHSPRTLVVSGRNGSGKSTLVKIMAGVLGPSGGTMSLSGPAGASVEGRLMLTGLVSPYLNLYEEFTAEENLRLGMAIRGVPFDRSFAHELLQRVALFARKDDPVRAFSSGMKQRAKYAFALIHRPALLLLDEPMANLDAEGIAIVKEIMAEQRQKGILVVATNDLSDVDRFDERVDLNVGR